jgi:hypothetical protein
MIEDHVAPGGQRDDRTLRPRVGLRDNRRDDAGQERKDPPMGNRTHEARILSQGFPASNNKCRALT